uniref:C-type lectin domain-containing protein n=1 Tax=Amphiprion ocellaris TaxID=80972 RepID=A0A3Q1C2K0_AMPOC
MFKLVLLFLTVSGLQSAPVEAPKGLQKSTHQLPDDIQQGTEHSDIHKPIPVSFRQGTEPSRRFLVNLDTGLVQEHVSEMERRVVPADVPVQRNAAGWVRVQEPSTSHLPAGFRQGTEPVKSIPDGFRQGTEPMMSASDDLRIVAGPLMSIPAGFRQGTEPSVHIPEGFKQGTEPSLPNQDGFRQGTEPILTIPEGFRQGTEPSSSRTQTVACKGEIINGNCYEFNPTPLAFQDAQAQCRAVAPNAELASVTSVDLQSRLVSLVTNGGESHPVLTWLGATIKKQQASWLDGSEWSYSDWMPGHPNVHTDKPVCVEMFKINESWWTAADCELKRASICSYQIAA